MPSICQAAKIDSKYLLAPRAKGWLLNGTFLFSLKCKPDAPDGTRIAAAIDECARTLWVQKGGGICADPPQLAEKQEHIGALSVSRGLLCV